MCSRRKCKTLGPGGLLIEQTGLGQGLAEVLPVVFLVMVRHHQIVQKSADDLIGPR